MSGEATRIHERYPDDPIDNSEVTNEYLENVKMMNNLMGRIAAVKKRKKQSSKNTDINLS